MNNRFKMTVWIRSGTMQESHRVFETDRTIVVGKEPSCELTINARGVSRKHCQLEKNEHGWTIIDLSSTNGILLNGKAISGRARPLMKSAIPLRDGDEIGIGEAVLRIQIDTEPELYTEILAPKRSGDGGEDQTETLIPTQPIEYLGRKQQALVSSKTSPRKESTGQVSTHPRTGAGVPIVPFGFNVPGDFRNYRLEKRVGVGGMGEVFLATDRSAPTQMWAIKFLKPQADLSEMDRARFVREMEIALNMQNHALIRCVDCGDENGQPFIVMDYCNGGNLQELLARSGKLTVGRALRLMDRLLVGVDFAHQLGIVHRDLKPSNILLHKQSGGKYLPKISDFGLAKSYLQAGESGMTSNGSVGGSWAYMPREQLTNFRFVSPQSDVWSLGAILYECLTLKLPRLMEKGSDPIRTILDSKIIPICEMDSDIHPELARFVMKCLAQVAEHRFNDAGAMRTGLKLTAKKVGVDL